MKFPKKTKRYCPYCRKHTEQKTEIASSGGKRGALTRGSMLRAKLRGQGIGSGSHGRWGSKPAVTKWKRKTKSTKKTNLVYLCSVCKKSKPQQYGRRVGKLTLE